MVCSCSNHTGKSEHQLATTMEAIEDDVVFPEWLKSGVSQETKACIEGQFQKQYLASLC